MGKRAWRGESHAREVDHDRLIIETDSQTARLFVRDTVVLRKRRCRRIMALDVTEEVAINARLESVNRLLEAANEELRASMQQVRKVAEAEAIMRMKARVHDTSARASRYSIASWRTTATTRGRLSRSRGFSTAS